MSWTNYDSVIAQMRAYGLKVDHLEIGRLRRCAVEGDREKRGWYFLHEIQTDDGFKICGSYGIWRGDNNNKQKIELDSKSISPEQMAAYRLRIREDSKRIKQERAAEIERAALRAQKIWAKCQNDDPTSRNDYLTRKQIQNHGLRYTPQGALVVPMLDGTGRIRALQFILSRKTHKKRIERTGRDKEYWPRGMSTVGTRFQIGPSLENIVILCEGYATGATIYEATGRPVLVCFDAGNLMNVAAQIRSRHKHLKILIAADDDDFQRCRECKLPVRVSRSKECPHCGQPSSVRNTGIESADAAALAAKGAVIAPKFEDDEWRWHEYEAAGRKYTDFNDLHVKEGLHAVRRQFEERLTELGWLEPLVGGQKTSTGAGDGDRLKPIDSIQELLDRYSLIYGRGGTLFDHQEHSLVALSDVRDACLRRELFRAWMEHSERKIVRSDAVGFDPSEKDPNIICNLWGGWPTSPEAGSCENLLDLLEYLCAADGPQLYEWVLKWLAYPIQHPGAKMRSALVIHGPQGAGKNLFFESVMAIYGEYGRIIDQTAIEDKFNEWASKKLFLIANEVIARSELYHVKNKLKSFITEDWIRINPKQLKAYDERNHINLVFLSNERMPVVLEEDDRRHCVIWTKSKMNPEYYRAIKNEIDNGGVAALHDYLLHLDLEDFNEYSQPPETVSRRALISLSLDSCSEFYMEYNDGEFGELNRWPVLSNDLYNFYRNWCSVRGYRGAANQKRFLDVLINKYNFQKARKRIMSVTGQDHPQRFIFDPANVKKPEGETEIKFYTNAVDQSRTIIEDWIGNNPRFNLVK